MGLADDFAQCLAGDGQNEFALLPEPAGKPRFPLGRGFGISLRISQILRGLARLDCFSPALAFCHRC